ncbi:MAG: MFS transporter [Pseudomonadota bacterium]
MSLAYSTRQPCDHYASQARGATPCSPAAQRWVLVLSVMGSSLAFIEGSIVNLALPSLQTAFDLDAKAVQWIVNAYLLTLSSLLLVGGAAGDRLGLRRVYAGGLALFGGASAACGLAINADMLIVFRALQGVGSAFLVPTSLALLNVYFEPSDRARAIGIWAGASALTTAAGPLFGGAFVDWFGWRSVFLLIAPLSFITLALALARIPNRPAGASESLDVVGAVLLMVSLGLLTYALAGSGSSAMTATVAVSGTLSLIVFVVYEARTKVPMLPLTLFRSTSFSGANVMTLLLYFALGGALYFIPFNLMQVQGYSAMQAGAAFLPLTLMLGLGSVLASNQLKRYSPRGLLTLGATLTGVGFALLMRPTITSSYIIDWLPGIALIGFGMTMCVAPLTTTVMASIGESHSGTASGINNTAARLAGLIAIAALTSLAGILFEQQLVQTIENVPLNAATADLLISHAGDLGGLIERAPTADLRDKLSLAYVCVFRSIMAVCAVLAGAAAAVAWFTLPAGKPTKAAS